MSMDQQQQLATVLEYQAWKQLDSLLRVTGAVTEQDAYAGPLDPANTPGRALYKAIREWGMAFAKLQIVKPEDHS